MNRGYGDTHAVYLNSNFLSDPALSKRFVKLDNNVATVLIDDTVNPYPQFLVTH